MESQFRAQNRDFIFKTWLHFQNLDFDLSRPISYSKLDLFLKLDFKSKTSVCLFWKLNFRFSMLLTMFVLQMENSVLPKGNQVFRNGNQVLVCMYFTDQWTRSNFSGPLLQHLSYFWSLALKKKKEKKVLLLIKSLTAILLW